ncbi:conserved hypothetical integral membrane protein TIGR02206 [Haloechinothrix alba]|uniref:Conserved hypothetical integral membrane protein TIGR02206 n=1 Tax=Haloechinothrix alba TaxID=664784 RepID=A0A238XCZ0_9PSEU|nr:TIGR02206 family membrane protein [Haloechinothrix alba]SNR56886.1 conserved hypothetical integral membrane protein TIGR02206 [Haloechinothrix alba]
MVLLAPAREFSAYGLSHGIILLLFAVGAASLVRAGRRHGDSVTARNVACVVGVTLLVVKLGLILSEMLPARWNVEGSLPLQLSDLAGVLAAYALLSRRRWACVLTYYWGLVLSTQALFTPALHADFPAAAFFEFWGMHLFVIWVAIYLTWGLRIHPDWRSYGIVVAVTVGWAATAFTVNSIVGSNYGYLNSKPGTASLLDVLGPWPWYLVPVAALVLTAWALMTWPWVRLDQRRDERARPPA